MKYLTIKDYENLVNEFSYDTDIKPEIYRILKYEYNIEHLGISEDKISDMVFAIQDKVLNMYQNLNK
jgi:hypothetical protein